MPDHDIAVSVRGLSKSYTIAHNAPKHTTMGEALVHTLKSLRGTRAPSDLETFWALKDVEFDIHKGDVVGIIGRNGAGKSTLLKVLSRITEPTTGQIDIYGRVGSLLEVGTGFHPELTGRENVYMNGAILGMSKAEISKNFDAIVDFSGTEQFLDTPVKRYSSGMYVRLAFAVAAHLNSEILIIDEVLAVGDAEFQKKCLGKMQDVANQGRTVLFVSHNMPMILRLCKRAILLGNGKVVADGTPNDIANQYTSAGNDNTSERVFTNPKEAPGDQVAQLRSIRVTDGHDKTVSTVDVRHPFEIEVVYSCLQNGAKPTVILHLLNEAGITLFATNDFNNKKWWNTPRDQGLVCARCKIPGNLMAEGRIFVMVAVGSYNPNVIHAMMYDAVSFQVVDHSEGDGVRGESVTEWPGVMRPMLNWDVALLNETPQSDNTSLDAHNLSMVLK